MVVCARLPNKPNMRGQNSLMSLVFWFPCWKNTNTSVQTKFLNDKLFDTFLNHNFTVRESNWNQGGGACNCAHQFLTYMKSRCMTYFVLLDPYRCSVKVVETWGVERFIEGNLDMYLICWQLFDWLIKLKIEIIWTVCAGLVVKYAGYWSLIKSTKSKKSQVVCTAPCVP